MFDAYVNQDKDKGRRRRWLSVVVAGSVMAHVVVIIVIMIAGMWKVEKNIFKGSSDIAVRTYTMAVAAPPPLGRDKAKTKNKQQLIVKRLVKNRQPTEQRASIKIEQGDGGDGPGRPDGQINGTGNDPNAPVTSLTACRAGDICGPGIPNVPRIVVRKCPGDPGCPPSQTRIVSATLIAGSRISGNAHIVPSDAIKLRIANADQSQVIGAVLMCLNTSGGVSKLKMVRSTGYNAYDQKILRTMRSWRYRPYRVNSTPVPVCSSITFIYRQTR